MTEPLLDVRIGLKHGAGGKAMRSLIGDLLTAGMPELTPAGFVGLDAMDDGAAIPVGDRWLVFTTDSHVVHPIFFPGGDIGRLAVSGTVNDLAMMGATEVIGLSCAVILEDGLARGELRRVQESLLATCREAHAVILTGDTKVMGKGELDGIVINTTGIGWADRLVRDNGLSPGDRIVVSGSIGDHGLAIMAARHQLGLEGDLRSDVAPVGELVRLALRETDAVVAMKDPTRGGLSSALHELAAKCGVGISLDEPAVPIRDAVLAASELLGIDPLNAANEGKVVFGVKPDAAERLVGLLREHPLGKDAAIVGTVTTERPGSVILDTGVGRRLLAEPEGELMPRIC